MRVKLRSSAYRDLVRGARFYERQEAGLGERFFDTLWEELEALCETGGMHVKVFGDYHRYVSKTFPYAVLYKVEEELVIIYAVFDCRRNPARLRRRLR